MAWVYNLTTCFQVSMAVELSELGGLGMTWLNLGKFTSLGLSLKTRPNLRVLDWFDELSFQLFVIEIAPLCRFACRNREKDDLLYHSLASLSFVILLFAPPFPFMMFITTLLCCSSSATWLCCFTSLEYGFLPYSIISPSSLWVHCYCWSSLWFICDC